MTDGHCATDGEAIYVGPVSTCNESNAGTAQAPVCSLQNGVSIAKSASKPVVIVRGSLAQATPTIAVSSPLTIVGKNAAVISPSAGGDAITITSGEIYLRNLTIQGSASPKTGIGINAGTGGGNAVTLHMDTCAVTGNPGGGILLNGAAFDIKNTTVMGNGPNAVSTQWGGIFVQSLPSVGASSLDLVSIQTNDGGGLTCSASTPIQGAGVLSVGNIHTVAEISPACNITTCTPAGTTCGAQSTPQ
jgi:nitrous oxidase accessory protein NosD